VSEWVRVCYNILSSIILSRQFIQFHMYSFVLFCADCIFISFLISAVLKWCSVDQPLTVLKYLISTDLILFLL
jgi:hypothetical protein